ncbi:MAG TPA: GAF domain-containing sensor histidine kinase [Elusimicrobiota bacterium]|nr:GAF domain-containing sensor histidine kinase [Elusimicrobiota bacterium]
MSDPRIPEYLKAVETLKDGSFQIELPCGFDDDIGRLGRALVDLGPAMEKKLGEIHTLLKITEKISSGRSLEEILNLVYDSFRAVIPYDRIGVALIEEAGATVRTRWGRSETSPQFFPPDYSAPLKNSSLQKVAETGRPRIINDLESYLSSHPESESTRLILKEGVRSSLTCPLIAEGKAIGFLFFSSRQRDTYRNPHADIFLLIAGLISEIIEKGRLHDSLLALNEQRSRILGMVVHDLRQPLSVIWGYLSYATDGRGVTRTETLSQLMRLAKKSCNSMIYLINDLLDIHSIEQGQLALVLQETDPAEFLKDFHMTHLPITQAADFEFTLTLDPDLPKVRMDANRIGQVLENLLSNAIKYSPFRTTISLRAENRENEAWISVADQGIGIPAKEIPSLFTEFGRGSAQPLHDEKSTGLGLAICKKLVQVHGGRIWVESAPGKGATFIFSLPALSS